MEYEPDLINIAYILIGKSDFDDTLYTIRNDLILVSWCNVSPFLRKEFPERIENCKNCKRKM